MKAKFDYWSDKLDELIGVKDQLIKKNGDWSRENEELQKIFKQNKDAMIKATEEITFSDSKIRRRNLADLQLLRESEFFLERAEEAKQLNSKRGFVMKNSLKELRILMLRVIDWSEQNLGKLDSTHQRISWVQDQVEELTYYAKETLTKTVRRKFKQYTLLRMKEAKLGKERIKLMDLNRSLRGKMKLVYKKFLCEMLSIDHGSSVQALWHLPDDVTFKLVLRENMI